MPSRKTPTEIEEDESATARVDVEEVERRRSRSRSRWRTSAEIENGEIESAIVGADFFVENMLLLERIRQHARQRRTGAPPGRPPTSARIDDLLELAGIAMDNNGARRWLEVSIPILRARPSPAPSPGEWNAPLDEVAKRAEDLLEGLRALRKRPHQHTVFWGSSIFGPIHRLGDPMIDCDQINSPIEIGLERGGIIPLLEKMVDVAQAARRARNGRPAQSRKQETIYAAAFFWRRVLCREKISASPTGPFYSFAQAFHAAVNGGDEDENVERHVRVAVRPRRNRAANLGRKPGKNPRVLS